MVYIETHYIQLESTCRFQKLVTGRTNLEVFCLEVDILSPSQCLLKLCLTLRLVLQQAKYEFQ